MTWLQRLLRRKQMEEQLDKELRFHLEQHVADLVERGSNLEEARREARLQLGGPEQVKESCREARGTRWLEDLWHDLRYALRTLRQKPGFAAIALVTLGLGTGAVTVMFTVINGVLLKPLPYLHSENLLILEEKTNWSTQWGDLWAFSYPNYLDCKKESRSVVMAAWRYAGGTISQSGEAEYVDAREISADLLPLLGVPLLHGRNFLPEEDKAGGTPVAIISYDFWQRHFGGDVAALGSPVVFEGKPYVVVGVTAARFRVGDDPADIFTPIGQSSGAFMTNRDVHRMLVWARLRPGITTGQASGELEMIGRHLQAAYPKTNRGRTFVGEPLRPDVGDVKSTLWLLLAAVGLVLLIACANIASLMLARAISRDRELAMRVALGASRGRLVRQCLTESLVLAVSGGALGVLLAVVGVSPFVALWPGTLPRAQEVQLDWRVLLFALGASLATGLLFGLAPALRAPSGNMEQTLRAGSRTVTGGARRLHGSFVMVEVALAVVLLVSAGMLGRTLIRLSALNPGLNIHNVLTGRMALSATVLASPSKIRQEWENILQQAVQVPGVEAATMVDTVPMREGNNQIGYKTTAAEIPADKQPLVLANSVSSDYLKVMGIPLLEGRFLDNQDREGKESVAVVDEVMARQAFGGEPAVGKHLWLGIGPDPVRVVGVVGHVRHWGLGADDQAKIRAQLYYPFRQVPDDLLRRWSQLMSIAVRTKVDPLSVTPALRKQLNGPAGDQVIYEVHSLAQLTQSTLARQRFLLLLFGLFAGLALLLACIGIYGVLAYLTGQRVSEIGVRMALGANTGDVIWMVMKQSLRMIGAGVIIGVAAALGAGRILQHLVDGVQFNDPLSITAMTVLLVGAALLASFIPARRASLIEPTGALRQD